MDWIQQQIGSMAAETLRELAPTIAMGILGLIAFGMLLGSLKKIVSSLFGMALSGGEAAVNRIMEKPKGVLLLAVMGMIVLPAWAAGYYYMPEKVKEVPVDRIVEKPVPYKVQDETEILRLRKIIEQKASEAEQARGEKQTAESRLSSMESALEAARETISIMMRQKREAEEKIASLTPKPKDAEITEINAEIEEIAQKIREAERAEKELIGSIDEAHGSIISRYVRNHRPPYGGLQKLNNAYYHIGCGICARDAQTDRQITSIRESVRELEKRRDQALRRKRLLANY